MKKIILLLALTLFATTNAYAGPLADRAIGNFSQLPGNILASLQVQRRVAGMPVSLHLVDLHLDGTVTDWNYREPSRLDGIGIDQVLARQIQTIGKLTESELAMAMEGVAKAEKAELSEDHGKGVPALQEHTVVYQVRQQGLTFPVAAFSAGVWKTLPGNPASGLMKMLNARFAGPYCP